MANVANAEPLPDAVDKILREGMSYAQSRGLSGGDAESMAFRHLNLAGYYKSDSGWKQMGPDRRKTVQIRRAVEQPDGTFTIENLLAFCPVEVTRNGKTARYDENRVRRAVENTNRHIENGGQRPPLNVGHKVGAPQTAKAASTAAFRIHPDGMVGLNVLELNRETKNAWARGEFEGLSVTILPDVEDPSLDRIAEVALLGSEVQAIGSLPAAHIFSAQNDYVCFSISHNQGATMAITNELKDALRLALDASKNGDARADEKIASLVASIHAESGKTGDGKPFVHSFSLEEHERDHKGHEHEHKDCEHCLKASVSSEGKTELAAGDDIPTKANPIIESKGTPSVNAKHGDPRSATGERHDDPPASMEGFSLAMQAAIKPLADKISNVADRLSLIENKGRKEDLGKKSEAFKAFMIDKIGMGHRSFGTMLSLYESVAENESAVDNLRKTVEEFSAQITQEADSFNMAGSAYGRTIATATPSITGATASKGAAEYMDKNWNKVRTAASANAGGLAGDKERKLAAALCVGN